MNPFSSIKELLNTLVREHKLLAEMFEKRKSLAYKWDYALELVDHKEERIQYLLDKSVLRANGRFLEIDDQFLQFFEQVLEVNEEINTSYINENIRQVKEHILYYLQENSETRKYGYLRAVKSALRKIGRITLRNIVDLNRNIDNTFKTEPSYKVKLAKLQNYDTRRHDIAHLIGQTEKLITEEEQTFFTTALDEELRQITTQLRHELNESRHNLIEMQKQIIEYINQVKYQSHFLEKIRQVKYLKDQFELRSKTDFSGVVAQATALFFEPRPMYPLKLSLEMIQDGQMHDHILKIIRRHRKGNRPVLLLADGISDEYLETETEQEVYLDLEELKRNFSAAGHHLFEFIQRYSFPREVSFEEKVTVFCQVVSIYESELNITEQYQRQNNIEFALIFPK
jgi:hypothetical protein